MGVLVPPPSSVITGRRGQAGNEVRHVLERELDLVWCHPQAVSKRIVLAHLTSGERSVSHRADAAGAPRLEPRLATIPDMPRTQEELIAQLRTHVIFLRRSGRLFDDGAEDEALRLAVSIRVLVHDTSSSTSVLKQLGVKTTLTYLDTYIPPPEPQEGTFVWHMGAGVAGLTADELGRPCYKATKDLHPLSIGPVPFDDWWNRSIIRDQAGADFTRRELALALANQDGGAHVDPELDEAYEALSRSNSLGWMAGVPWRVGDGEADGVPMGSPVPANVRQIAWELEQSLMDQLGEHLEFLPVI